MNDIRQSSICSAFWVASDCSIYSQRNGEFSLRTPSLMLSGYVQVRAQTGRQCVYQAYQHVLICERFIGPRPTPLHEVRHLDGTRANNAPSNLTWGTRRENAADRIIHGTTRYAESAPRFKLTAAQVDEIRGKLLAGANQYALAAEYGVDQSLISRINTGERRTASYSAIADRGRAAEAIGRALERPTERAD